MLLLFRRWLEMMAFGELVHVGTAMLFGGLSAPKEHDFQRLTLSPLRLKLEVVWVLQPEPS